MIATKYRFKHQRRYELRKMRACCTTHPGTREKDTQNQTIAIADSFKLREGNLPKLLLIRGYGEADGISGIRFIIIPPPDISSLPPFHRLGTIDDTCTGEAILLLASTTAAT